MPSAVFWSSVFLVIFTVSSHKHSGSHEDLEPWSRRDAGVVSDRASNSQRSYDDASINKVVDSAGIFANALGVVFGNSKRDESQDKKWSWTEGATNFVKDCGNLFSRMIGWSSSDGPSRGRRGGKGGEESSGALRDESGLDLGNNKHEKITTRVTRSVAEAEEPKETTTSPSVTTSLYIVACYLGGWGCKNGEGDTGKSAAQSLAYQATPDGKALDGDQPWYERRSDSSGQDSQGGSGGQQYGRSGGEPSNGGYQEVSGGWSDGSAAGDRKTDEQPFTRRLTAPEGAAPSNVDRPSGSSGRLSHAKSTWAEVTSGLPKARTSISDVAASARTGVSDTASSVVTSVGQFLGETSERAGAVGASAGEAWNGAKEEARRLGSTVDGRVTSARESLSSSASGIGERISAKWDQFKSGAGQTLTGATKSIDEWSTEAKERASKTLTDVTSAAKGAVGEAANSVGQLGSSIGEGITNSASTAVHSVGSTLGDAVGSTRQAFGDATKSLTEFGKETSSRVEGAFGSTKSAIGDALSSTRSDLENAASSAVHGVGSTLGDAFNSLNQVKTTIGEFGSSAADSTKEAFNDASNSVTSAVDRTGSSLGDAVDSTRTALGDAASTAAHTIDSSLNAAGEQTKEAFRGATNSITEFGSSIGSTLEDTASSVREFGATTLNRAGSTLEGAADSTKSAIGDAASSVSEFGSSIGERASTAAHSVSESLDGAASSIRSGFGEGIDTASTRVGETLTSVGNKGSEWLSSASSSLGDFGNGITDSLSSAATRTGEAIDSTAQEASDSSSSFLSSVSSTVSGWFSSSSSATPSEGDSITEAPPPVDQPTGPGLISNIGSTLFNWMTREDETTPAPIEETTTTTETPQTTTEYVPTEPTPSTFVSVGSTLISWFSSSVAKSAEASEATTDVPDVSTTTYRLPETTTEPPTTTTTEDPRPGLLSNAGSVVYNWWTKEAELEPTEQPKSLDGTDDGTTVETTSEPYPSGDGDTTTANPEEATTTGPSTFSSVGSTIMSWFSSNSGTASETTTSAPDEVSTSSPDTTDQTMVATGEGDAETTTASAPEETTGPGFFSSIGNTVSGWFSSSSSGGTPVESTTASSGDASETFTSFPESAITEQISEGVDATTPQAPDDSTGSSSFLSSIGDTVSGWFSSSGGSTDSTTLPPETGGTEVSSGEASTTNYPSIEPSEMLPAAGEESETTTSSPEESTGPSFLSSIGDTVSGWFSSSGGSTESTTLPSEVTTSATVDQETTASEEGTGSTFIVEPTGPSFLTSVGDTVSGWFSSSGGATMTTAVPSEESVTSSSATVEETTPTVETADSTAAPVIVEATGPSFLTSIGDTVSGWFSTSGKPAESTLAESAESSTIASETSLTSYESSTVSTSVDETTLVSGAGEGEATTPSGPEDSTGSSFFSSIGDTVSGWFSSSGGAKDTTSSPDAVTTEIPSEEAVTTAARVEDTTASPPDESTSSSLLTSIGETVSGWFSSSSSSTSEAPTDSLIETSTATSADASTADGESRTTEASPIIETGSTMISSAPDSDALISSELGAEATTSSIDLEASTMTAGFELTTTLSEPGRGGQEPAIPMNEGESLSGTTDASLIPSIDILTTELTPSSSSIQQPTDSEPTVEETHTPSPDDQPTPPLVSEEQPSSQIFVESSTFATEEAQTSAIDDTTASIITEETTTVADTTGVDLSATTVEPYGGVRESATPIDETLATQSLSELPSTTLTTPIDESTVPTVFEEATAAQPDTTDPSLISTIGTKITEWFSSSSSSTEHPPPSDMTAEESSTPTSDDQTSITEDRPASEEASPTLIPDEVQTATIDDSSASRSEEFAATVDGSELTSASAMPEPELTIPQSDGATDLQPETTDPSLISSIGSKITEWFSSSSSSTEQPSASENADEGTTTMPNDQTPSSTIKESSTVPTVIEEATERSAEEYTTEATNNEASTTMSSTLDDITGHSSLVTSIGSTVANWFSSSSSGVPESSDFIKPDREETTTITTEEVEIPSVTTEQSVIVDPYEPIVPVSTDSITIEQMSSTSQSLIESSIAATFGEEPSTPSPFDFTSANTVETTAASEDFTTTPPDFEVGPSSSTARPDNEYGNTDDNTIYVTEPSGKSTTEGPMIRVSEIIDDVKPSSSSSTSTSSENDLKNDVVHAWSWLEQNIGDKSSDWKHQWEWMNAEDEENRKRHEKETAVAGHTKVTHHNWPWVHEQSRDSPAPHQQRSDRGLAHAVTPQWLWDQASGSLRYARDSPTPTVDGKGVCSAMVAASEFENDERGGRRVRSPSNPIQFAGYDYYWDTRFLPVIVRPQRRSICTHFITKEEMEEEVELGNGTTFTSIAWTCPPLHECCEWECCMRVGEMRWIIYVYFLLLLILAIVVTALSVLLFYSLCIVLKKRAKTAPVPFAVYVAPPISPPTNGTVPVPAFGVVPHRPSPGTSQNLDQLYNPDPDPTSFTLPPPAYHDVKYYV